MAIRVRLLGILIVACGLAVCYGAAALWPTGVFATPLGSSLSAVGLLRVAGAGIAALLGVGNVAAGLAVVFLNTARD